MPNFRQSLQKGNASLHTACAAEKAACDKSFMEMSKHWSEKAARKKRIEKLIRRLETELAVQKGSAADKRNKEDALSAKEKLREHFKQLSARVADLDSEVKKKNEVAKDLHVKLKGTKKMAEAVAYKTYGMPVSLQPPQSGK